MHKKTPLLVVLALVASAVLAACGDNTATTAPATTAAATTAAATTAAATTAAATTAAATTAAATTAAATTAAATTAATTAAATTPAATTAAATTAAASGAPNLALQGTLAPAPAGAPTGGTFTYVSLAGELAPVMHPYPSAADNSQSVAEADFLIWDGNMVEYDFTNLVWVLHYAKDMKVSADGKTFTFTLRDGLKWSDGSDVTVADYQFAYDNAIKEDTANPDNNFVGLDDLKKIKLTTDDATKTLTFALDDVYATDLALSYISAVLPVPAKVWTGKPWYDATANSEITKPTVTNGPYTFAGGDAKSQYSFKANPTWFRGKSIYDTIVFKPGSATTVVESVKTGQADYTSSFPPAQYAAAKQDSNLNVYDWSAVNGTYRTVDYNTRRAPLNDKAVRQAINYAIDRDNLIKLAENGLGTPQYSFVNPQSPYYNSNVNQYKYNLDTAKKTLADAGYKLDGGKLIGKDGKQVTLTVAFPTSSNPRVLIATYLQQQLGQLGIAVNVDGKEFNAFLDQVYSKYDFDISLGASGGGFPDPDGFKYYATTDGSQNDTGYGNKTLDDLFTQGAKETDPTKRKAIYDQAQQILSDDTPYFFLWNLNSFELFTTKIKGVQPGFKGSYHGFTNADITRWYTQA
jgi:peptide/nickel transport system substrate-binding protein